jgi:hypothetical protein
LTATSGETTKHHETSRSHHLFQYFRDSFYFKSKPARRKELLDYQFICDCDACVKDYPDIVVGNLEPSDHSLNAFALKVYNEMKVSKKPMKPEKAREMAIKYSSIMQQNYEEEKYPCREIVLLQLCIIKCFLQACKSTISFP